jgi:predicted site-specific integrase-resolvase
MSEKPRSTVYETDGHVTVRERELSERWQVSGRTLQRWRAQGFGPAYILIGGTIRYRMADILDYEARRSFGGR